MSESPPLSFEEFARQPEYIAINRGLVEAVYPYLPGEFNGLDVATGTGMVPKLAIEVVTHDVRLNPKQGLIVGLDPNPVSLEIARATTPMDSSVQVVYTHGYGQDADQIARVYFAGKGADWTSIHDAIHEIPELEEKQAVLAAMVRALKPGGILSLNSAFTDIAMRNSMRDWGQLKSIAHRLFGEKRDKAVLSLPYLTTEEYKGMLTNLGLNIIHERETEVNLTIASLRGICAYPTFIEGLYVDMINTANYSTEEKYRRLMNTIDQITAENPNKTFSRLWWEAIAQKPRLNLLPTED